jgi:hypothetical protein
MSLAGIRVATTGHSGRCQRFFPQLGTLTRLALTAGREGSPEALNPTPEVQGPFVNPIPLRGGRGRA